MTVIQLPSGYSMDFEDADEDQINDALAQMREDRPDLFESPPDLGTASLSELRGFLGTQARAARPPDVEPDHEGEVRDAEFQFLYGRADNINEKAKRIEDFFGPDSYQQVEGTDKFLLKLDNISPELKKQYGLPDSGTMYVNKPGFSWYDVAAFGGMEAAPLTAALGVGLAFSGVGLVPGMILMAAAGAGGKAFDELIIEDRLEKMNTQSDEEVYGDIALTGAFYGLGEGLGRGLWALGRRLIKGPGARPDPSRIAELVQSGMGRAAATKIAREEYKTELRRAVAGDKELGITGARPTVSEVSQKAIMGRIQSIYEGIFPNAQAAARNLEFVQTTLARLGAGQIDEASAKAALNQQAKAVGAEVAARMKNADVDEAVRLANRHLEKVIENEFKVLQDLYNPNVPLDKGWVGWVNQAARMFDQDSSHLYKKAEDLLKGVKTSTPEQMSLSLPGESAAAAGRSAADFDAQTLKNAINNIRKDKAFAAVSREDFSTGLFGYIMGKKTFTITELTSLRTALRSVGKDPALMPGVTDKHIGSIIKAIGETIDERLQGLAFLRTKQAQNPNFLLHPELQSLTKEQTAILRRAGLANLGPIDDATAQLFEKGITAYLKASHFYSKGVARFKSFSEDLLFTNLKRGVNIGPKEVLEAIVAPGNATKINAYLKGVTPSGRTIEGIGAIPQSVFDDAAKAAVRGDLKEMNRILDTAGVPPDFIKRAPAFMENLPRGPNGQLDSYVASYGAEMADMLRTSGSMAAARANPLAYRNSARDALAREWLDQTYRSSVGPIGGFSPGQFATQFRILGDDVQNVLFGKENASAMRQLTRDYYRVGEGNKEFARATAEALGSTASAIRARTMGLTGGRSVADEIANVQSVMREAERQSSDDLFQAIAKGKIDDADTLVLHLLKTPKDYNRLINEFGLSADALQGPLGVKDMVMSRIMAMAFPEGITPDRISSGAWGAPMRRVMSEFNRNGALARILGDGIEKRGQPIVDDLFKASKIGERISDTALKGKQGLASAAFAAGAGMRLITNPLAFIGEAAGIFTMGRIMRQKWFLNSLLQPRYSAGVMGVRGGRRLLQAGRRAGADLEGVSPLGLEVRERVAQEARLIVAAMGEGQVGSDTREEVTETVRENIVRPLRDIREEVTETVRENIARLPQGLQIPTAQPPQGIQVPGAQIRPPVSPLRQAADPRYQAMQDVLGNP